MTLSGHVPALPGGSVTVSELASDVSFSKVRLLYVFGLQRNLSFIPEQFPGA